MDEEQIERTAKAMALYSGWDKWESAKNFCDTLSGNEPEEERQYWRELAKIAISHKESK